MRATRVRGPTCRGRRRRRQWLAVVLLALALPLQAGPPAEAEREVAGLIDALGGSGCDFQRNGRWHPAATARAHLQRKYAWLRERDLVDSAEQFIERAGTRSSLSGRAYQVRCPGQPVVPAAHWLRGRLQDLRRHAAHAG